ncbi:hypothetical protein [Streptomyces sp. NPDC000229]|uniref:hypothetical protein n=1 Tax=Streptomyces sp. NPDC000229 TaxID=3154247 RepID=UPI00332C0193
MIQVPSCSEVGLRNVPHAFSGYPAGDDSGWAAFRAEYDRTRRELWAGFSAWVTEQGAPPLPDLEFIHEADTNLYVYPEAADYARVLPPHWHRLDSCVRETDEAFSLPPDLADLGFGARLDTYRFTDEELTGALERLFGDTSLRERPTAAGAVIRERDGLRRAADLIEEAAARGA